MNEIKASVETLTQQVISRSHKVTAPRASASRTEERVDTIYFVIVLGSLPGLNMCLFLSLVLFDFANH